MASQGAQRPRRNASPSSSSTKPQPMRATMPFSLSTKNRNPSPPRGSFVRKSSPTSSSPVLNEGSIKATRRTSPEIRTSPECRDRRSPTSPLTFISPRVERPKSNTPIHRTSSLDALPTNYLNSQWPGQAGREVVGSPAAMVTKGTQTPGWDDMSQPPSEHPKHQRSASWGSADNLKEKFRQHRQRTKQSGQLYGRQSPIAGDHTAVANLGTTSSSIPIPAVMSKQPVHTRCSMEGFNSEIQGLVINDGEDSVFYRSACEQVPDGHRAPFPRRSVSVNTQTCADMFDYHDNNGAVNINSASQTHSPPSGQKTPRTSSSEPGGRDSSSPDVIPGFKYASSPKPNNSYLFGREPPDGAEKVPLHVDEITEERKPCVLAPDKSKGFIKFSTQSPFHSILPSKVAAPALESDNAWR